MKIYKLLQKCIALLLIVTLELIFVPATQVFAAQSTVDLGTADSFAVLAGSGITNTGSTTITGDVGTFPTTTETGFGSVTINGTNHAGDTTTQGAKTDLVTAYNDAAGRGPTNPITADLGGQTLVPGVYNSASSIGLTGTLTLNALGDPDAVFIFQAGSTLITAPGSSVNLINGGQSCNVFWQVGSSATLDTTTNFNGTIIALTSITLNTGATIHGRALARNGAVTMDTNTITREACATTSTSTSSSSSSSSGGGSSSPQICPTVNVSAPVVIESRRVSPTSIFVSWGPESSTNLFNVKYGFDPNNLIYNTNVTGYSTTINDLPANQPIWVQVAGRNDCSIGAYGPINGSGVTRATLVGVPRLPNTGVGTHQNNLPWLVIVGISTTGLLLIHRKYKGSQ